MDRVKELKALGGELGLQGSALQTYVTKQQEHERLERAAERERRAKEEERKFTLQELELTKQKLAMEMDLAERQSKEADREHQRKLELGKQPTQAETLPEGGHAISRYIPKLPPFDEAKDDMDAYLKRFETLAASQKWPVDRWAVGISTLLKGKSLDVYSRLAPEQAMDYDEVKTALLRRFDFTEEGFRKRFRQSRAEQTETVGQFVVRLDNYLTRWLDLANCEKTYKGLIDMILREQVLFCCNAELTLFLRERSPANLKELTTFADRFVEARGGVAKAFMHQKHGGNAGQSQRQGDGGGYRCQQNVQRSQERSGGNKQLRNSTLPGKRHCFLCNSPEHLAAKCPHRTHRTGVGAVSPTPSVDMGTNLKRDDSGISRESANKHRDVEKHCSVAVGNQMPVVQGHLNNHNVQVLRDTGCSGIVVRQQLVDQSQQLGMTQGLKLVDGTERCVPVAEVRISSPYFNGTTKAWCMDNPLYDVIIGNVPGAHPPDKPNLEYKQSVAIVETRAQKQKATEKRTLSVPTAVDDIAGQDDVIAAQQSDGTLTKLWKLAQQNDVKEVKGVKTRFYMSNKILYRECIDQVGRIFHQLVVPKEMRETVLRLAHDSSMAGHLGIAKTTDRILTEYFWPGCRSDIICYCKSCDRCQRTVHRGSVRKVPLGDMPIIDRPFDKVAVDIIGPLYPASDRGYRYILTLVDFATRYPEAVALKRIEAEDIAEALVDIFSRVGVPREMLSDRGSQFTSGVMQEVSRLLSLRRMTTTPYHPAANGLVERFNGTLKQMLKRMCIEQPSNWDKYINPLLFAYREVPQDSLGFAPFELLYGHHVRGPLRILKELWTKSIPDPDVKTTYQYVVELKDRLEETCKLAHENLRSAKFRQAKQYNKSAKERHMEIGQKVLVLRPLKRNKLQLQWMGPFEIVEKVGLVDYRINIAGKIKTFHANMLKLYTERQSDSVTMVTCQTGVFACAGISVIQETYEDSVDGQLDRYDANPLLLPHYESTESVDDVHISSEIGTEKQCEVMTLLNKYRNVMTDLPGRTTLATHEIRVVTEEPVRVKPYPIPYHTTELIKREVDKMLAMDIIEPSESSYSSPVVLVRKKDASYRFCVDYRQINKICIFDCEPMPTPDDLFVKLAGCKFFSKLDLSKGYWQVPLSRDAAKKSAFSTPFGLYQFKVMSFGLMNAPATFSRLMRKLLAGIPNVVNFLDDILIYSNTWTEHMGTLRAVLERLSEENLTARPSKCYIGFDRLECLGHMVGRDIIQPTPDKMEAISSAPQPKTKKQVKSFIGLASYYRKFIPNFASIAVPLTDLTRKGMPNKVGWTEAQENAFTTLKKLLTSSPILRLPNMEEKFLLRTDASDLGIGAVLLQELDSIKHPVAYASRKLLPRERRYSVIEKECLALVWGVNKFSQYLLGQEFDVETDHQPLTCISNKKVANSRIMRWALLLQPFRMTIKAIPGRENVGADYLSRVAEP